MTIPRQDPEEKRVLAEDAEDLLLHNRAFSGAILALRQQWFGELMGSGRSVDEVMNLRAQLMALEALPRLLSGYMSAYAREQQNARRN